MFHDGKFAYFCAQFQPVLVSMLVRSALALVPKLSSTDMAVLWPLLLSLVGYVAYWWVYYSPAIKERFLETLGGHRGVVAHTVTVKSWGFLVMAALPVWVLAQTGGWTLRTLGWAWPTNVDATLWLWWGGLLLFSGLLSMMGAHKGFSKYPQMEVANWSWTTYAWSSFSWVMYLTGCEFMFRGYLLFPLSELWGPWPAVIVSTLLYSLSHFHKGKGELLLCLPAGVLMGWMTLQTGSMAHALFGHVVLAWFNTAYNVSVKPELAWVRQPLRVL